MPIHRVIPAVIATLVVALFAPALPAGAQTAPILTGKVSSTEEGAMEGVIVSAKKGIVTVSVVSNDKGEFSFPASKLGAGDYALSIKAGGYDIDGANKVTLTGQPKAMD